MSQAGIFQFFTEYKSLMAKTTGCIPDGLIIDILFSCATLHSVGQMFIMKSYQTSLWSCLLPVLFQVRFGFGKPWETKTHMQSGIHQRFQLRYFNLPGAWIIWNVTGQLRQFSLKRAQILKLEANKIKVEQSRCFLLIWKDQVLGKNSFDALLQPSRLGFGFGKPTCISIVQYVVSRYTIHHSLRGSSPISSCHSKTRSHP